MKLKEALQGAGTSVHIIYFLRHAFCSTTNQHQRITEQWKLRGASADDPF